MIQVVYGDWVHSNNGANFSGGFVESNEWQKRWQTLAVIPIRSYNAPSRRVRWRFMYALAAELMEVWQCRCNAERLIIFQTVILQRAQHVTSSGAIKQRIDRHLDAW